MEKQNQTSEMIIENILYNILSKESKHFKMLHEQII